MQQSNLSDHKNFVTKTNLPAAEKKHRIILPVIIWITGLILAGSEGALMPWLNMAGGVVFFSASIWLGKILPDLEPEVSKTATVKKKIRHPEPAQALNLKKRNTHALGLAFCSHDHSCA